MEHVARSRRSIRKQCKLSDYVTNTVAANMSCQTIPSMVSTIEGQGDSSAQNEQPPKTPSTPKNQNLQAKTPLTNPFMARIQRDLNSPSANVRLRALKAIRSPTKSAYGQFDVSHNEKSIITADEREQAAKTPPSLRDILKDIIVYVEVRTDDDDRSAGVKKVIATLGARVNDNLRRDTTHVIFKDGRLSTFKKAKSLGIPIVSILWIEACKNQRRICDPKDFQISNLDRYENPELYGKMRRYKFIQPGAEDKKRRPKKQAIEPTPPKSNNSQTDIGRFCRALDKTASKTGTATVTPVRSKNVFDSPATVFLNRITSNTYTPIASASKVKSAVENVAQTTPVTTNRRTSIETNIDNTTDSIAQLSLSQMTPEFNQFSNAKSASKVSKQRRRTMLPIANSTRISDLNETCNDKQPPAQSNQDVVTEELIVENKKSSEAFTVCSTVRRQTSMTCKTMEITTQTPEQKIATRRRTLFTPQAMVECSQAAMTTATAAPEPLNDETIVEAVPILTTPTLSSSEDISASAAPISSARHLCRRRTLYDISMDIISHQVQHINAKSRQSMLPPPATPAPPAAATQETKTQEAKSNENANECNTSVEKPQAVQMIDAACGTTVEKKKRKLFKPLDSSPFSTPPITPSKAARDSSSGNSITPKIASKRRRTLMSVKSSDALANALVVDASPSLNTAPKEKKASKASLLSRRSTLDFEPPVAASIKPKKPEALTTTTKSSTTLKENNINSTNASQDAPDDKPNAIAKRRLPFLAFTNMRSEQVAMIHEAVKRFGCFVVERTVGSNTTHMVSLEARRTMNILRGLVRGLWILDYNWILDSLKAGYWLSEELYEMKDFSRAVEICRAERQAFGQHYKCELFADLGAFFISSRCDNIPGRDLKELIRLCGGNVVEQRKNAKYILSSSTRAVDDKIYVTPLWILDSITKMQLLRIQKYSAVTQLPTKYTPSNTRNMPTAVDSRE